MRLAFAVLVLAITAAPARALADDSAPALRWSWDASLQAGRMLRGPHDDPALLVGAGARGALYARNKGVGLEAGVDAATISPECEQGDRFSATCSAYRFRALGGLRFVSSPHRRTMGVFRLAGGVELLGYAVATTDNEPGEPSTTTRRTDRHTGGTVEASAGFVTGGRGGRVGAELAVDVAFHEQPNFVTGATAYTTFAIELRLVIAFGP